jgi:hypothetical protein|tara:strand:+ start:309 stop:650 length:342 start_codon:yes stop_codon:yes gene_type:complete
MDSRHDEMLEQCMAFHEANPEVWNMFVYFTQEIINKGYENYSVNAIFERIRWEKDMGGDGTNQFKINNNYRAFYARRFMNKHPEYQGFFRTRELKSIQKPATGLPELTPEFFE